MPSVLAPLREAATYRSLAFLVSGLLLGPFELTVLVTGWSLGLALLITPLIVFIVIAMRGVVGALAQFESALARELLGADVHGGRLSSGGHGIWNRTKAVLADGEFWRELAYLALRVVAGWPLAIATVSLVGGSLYLVFLPLYIHWTHTDIGSWHLHTLQQAALLMPVGVLGLLLALNVVRPVAGMWRQLVAPLLRGGDASRVDDRVEQQRTLRVAAGAVGLIVLITVIVWAGTGAGTFWPVWPMLGLGMPLAAFAWVVYVGSRRDWHERGVDGVAIAAGVAGSLLLMFVAVWAITGAGYFWPLWPALAFALVLGLYALAIHQGSGPAHLRERISVLEETRAGAVDVQETELRRIERDLHDGAQARLVALGMNLGMAEQKLAADPEAAAGLVAEARLGVEEALRELRDLARGIHPPVLTDRGLEAAISALALRSAVPVFVSADVPTRPPAAVETAAYFVAAEALTNAAKHARATRIDVHIERLPASLVVEVADDGRGGAVPAGSGLTGLRHRVEALDGKLTIASPSGGGTTLRAELPCVS